MQAVNYQHRSGATKLNFAGTDLMPAARGQAKVESKKGYLEIEVEFANFERPTTFGGEISPTFWRRFRRKVVHRTSAKYWWATTIAASST